MNKIGKIIILNILIFLILVIIFETIAYTGRIFTNKINLGWLYHNSKNILSEQPCVRMKTHPIFSHIPDHKDECIIKGGVAKDTYVFYENNLDPAIVTLGGSTTSGFYQHYANGDTYPYLFAQLVKNKNLQVINGGHGGYSSSQELLKLILEVRAFEIKVNKVISLNGINDLIKPNYKNPFIEDRPQEMLKKQIWINQSTYPKLLPNIWSLIRYFAKEDSGSNNIQNLNKKNNLFRDISPVKIWEANIKSMNSISKAMGSEYYAFLQPTMGLPGIQSELPQDKNSSDYVMLKELLGNEIKEGYEDWYLPLLRESYEEMKKICSGLSFCYDISDVAPPIKSNYDNPRHHNSAGNQIIAKTIYKIIFE